ncbi:MAG TPA: divalent metal cation transporter [Candidatus Eremiobacteraceae bacterium]|nr:divalent metal cation transporter [Candidatus Eremiobacteraceae bacterium]
MAASSESRAGSDDQAESVKPASVIGVREAHLQKEPNPILRFLKILGPGIIVGASDDDPSGIGTYAVAGASLGFSTLWTALVCLPMMSTVQFICAKIGLVTGMGLAGLMRRSFSKAILLPVVFALVIANTINAGADLGAIAAALNLIVPKISIIALIVPISLVILALQIWGSYRIICNVFKWLSLALLAYVASAFFAHPSLREVLSGTFVPHLQWSAAYITTIVAILGTTISPYMFFWQANQEVEEDIEMGRKALWQRRGTTDTELKYAFWDINIGMFFSQVVMYFIIMATAATLFKTGHNHIASAADAAKALQPLAGKGAEYLLALGLIGAGFLAVPILTGSAGYALSEAFGWKYGLGQRPDRAPQFYTVIALSTLVGMQLNFMGINPIAALYWTAVINGVLAPILLVFIMLIANNKKIMGARVNGAGANILGWATTGAMALAALALFLTWGKS